MSQPADPPARPLRAGPVLRGLRSSWPFVVVCAGAVVGLGVVVLLDRFRRGTLVMAGAVLLGAWLRALLPSDQVGLLRVRGRAFDVLVMLALGLGLSVVALVVPPAS